MNQSSTKRYDLCVVDDADQLFIADAELNRTRPITHQDLLHKVKQRRAVNILLTGHGSESYRNLICNAVKDGQADKLTVGADASDFSGGRTVPSLMRKFSGKTAGLHVFNATVTALGQVEGKFALNRRRLEEVVDNHPAARAYRFLIRQGASPGAAVQVLHKLYDIRYAVALGLWSPAGGALERAMDAVTAFGHEAVKLREITPWMLKQYENYAAFKRTDYSLFEGIIGERFRMLDYLDESFPGVVISQHSTRDFGVCHAVLCGLGLLISEWMAKEFHPDLFDSYPLQFGFRNDDPYGSFRDA